MTAQIDKQAKASIRTSLEPLRAVRPAVPSRVVRLSVGAALLASSAMVPLQAQTFNIGGGTRVVADFTGPPLNGATEITNGELFINTTVDLPPFTGTLNDSLGQLRLTKSGGGSATLSGPNSYTGRTTVQGGTLIVASSAALGTPAQGTIVDTGATLALQGGITIVDSLILAGAGVGGNGALRNNSGTNNVNGDIVIGAGGATIGSSSGFLVIRGATNNNGNLLTSTGSGSTTFVGAISGTGGFTKTGSGQTDLNGTNTYTGTTTVESGILILNGGSGIIDTGRVVVNGGAFGIFNDETIGSLEGTGGFVSVSVSSGTRRLTVGGNNLSTSYAGDLRNNGGGLLGLIKTGTGTLTLTSASTYSGGTTINNGTIVAGNSTALGTGNVNFSGTSGKVVADFNGTFANPLFVVGIAPSGTFAAATGRTVTITGDITTSTNAVVNFGSATETGTIVFNSAVSGNLTSDSRFAINGGTLRLANAMSADTASVLFNLTQGLTIGSDGTFDLGGVGFTGWKIGGTGTILNSGAARTLSLNNSTFAGTLNTGANGITLTGTLAAGLGALTKRGTGTLTLSSVLTTTNHTEGLTLAEGTLSLQGNLASTFGAIRTTGSAIDYGDGVIVDAPLVIDSNTTQLQVLSGAAVQSGVISEAGGARGFEKIGGGTLVLRANNTYTGITTITGGTLQIGANGTLGTLGTGNVVNNATLAFDRSNNLTVSNVITGSGALVKLGGGITTLLGENTYAGTTTITGGTLRIGDGGTTGTLGTGDVVNNLVLEFNRSDDITVANAIGGTGTLSKRGTGILTLTGNNTYSGNTSINFGTLQVGNGGTTGTLGTGDVALTSALVFNRSDDIVVANTISGFGTLRQQGTGTLILTANNGYTGTTTISAGTLQIGNGGNTGTLGTVNVVNNAALVFNRANNLTVANVISGSGTLTKQGGGVLTLSGANSYDGVTTVSAGTLSVNNAAALGSTTGNTIVSSGATLENRVNGTIAEAITINGSGVANAGALLSATNATFSNAITLGSASQINIAPGSTVRFNGGISGTNHDLTIGGGGTARVESVLSLGSGNLIKDGSGGLLLTGNNTYGTTTINAGQIAVGNGGTTGTLGSGNVVNNGALSFNRSNDITVANTISGTGSVSQAGASSLILTGNNSYAGGTSVFGGRLVVGSDTALGTEVVLMAGGALQLGVATTPGVSAGPITMGNRINLLADTEVNLVGVTGVMNVQTGVLTTTGTTATLNGAISGGSRMTFSGSGTLTLNGNNTYSGGTTLNPLAEIGNANAFGTGAVTLNEIAGLRNTSGSALTLANNFVMNGFGNTVGGTSNLAFTGNLSGNGFLYKVQGNTLAINSAVNDFSGALIINGGTVLVNGTMGNAGASVVVNSGGTLGGTGTIAGAVIVASGGTLAAGQSAGTLRLASNLRLNAGSNTIFELAQAGVAGGANNDLIRVTGTLALNGGGISVVRGTGFSAGEYTLFEFGTLSGAIGNMTLNPLGGGFAGSLALGTNTVLMNVAGAADQVRWNGSTLAPTGSVVGGSGTWDLVNGNFSNAAGTVSGPWAGNGALAIFGGATGGTVTIANDTVLSPSGLTFETNGYTIAAGNGGSRLDLTGPTGIETLAGISATIAAPITGVGSITKNGDGTLVLTGANSYAGGTSILGGTLQVGDGGSSGSLGSGNVLNNAALVFNRADEIAVNGVISGSGTLTQQGSGGTILTGANTYDGLTTVAAGTLTAANNTALGSTAAGTVVNAGATLAVQGLLTIGEAVTLNGAGVGGGGALRGIPAGKVGNETSELQGLITLASDATITVVDRMGLIFTGPGIQGSGTQTLTFASEGTGNSTIRALGPITNIAGLIKNGPGLLELGGINTFTGPVTINGGDVNLTGGAALADSVAVTMSAPARLAIAASETIGSLAGSGSVLLGANMLTTGGNNASTSFGGVISGSLGRLTKVGTGTFTLTGANTYTGATRIEGGTLALGANDVISNSSEVQIAGGTLALGTFTDTVASVSLSSGSITGSTGGALTVTGTYFQSGGTLAAGATVNAGAPFRLDGGTIAGTLNSTAIGTNAGVVGVGSALVTGRVLMVGDLYVGQGGAGAIAVNAGGLIRSRDGVIGSAGGTGSSATVSGAGSRWEASSAMAVGFTTAGSLLIENGGVVSSASSFVSFTASAPGSVVVTGVGSRWENTGLLQLGARGAGTLTIADGGAVTAANVVIARDATATGALIFGAAEGSAAAATGTLASPTITLGAGAASIIFNHTAADFELAAAISGNGSLRQLAGTTTLSGASTFTGTTSVLGGSLGVTGALASAVTNNAALTNTGTISGLVTNNAALTSTGTLGGGLVNAAGANANNSGTIAGAVTNAGTLTNSGSIAGLLTNSGALTSTGTLGGGLDNSGTASLSGAVNGNVHNSGTITLTGATTGIGAFTQAATGVFALGGNSTAIGSLAGAGAVQLGSAALTAGSNNASTLFSGIVSGSGGLAKVGTGTLTLSGANTFTGLTTVSAGTLAINAGGVLAGGVTNNAALTNAGTIAGAVSNAGTLTNSGTLGRTLANAAGANASNSGTIAGAVTNAGTLANSGTISGLVTNNAALTSTGTLGGGLDNSGTASLSGAVNGNVQNSGTITLTGATTGIGAFTQTATGVFALGGNAAAIGSLAGAGTVQLGSAALTTGGNNASTLFSGIVSGSGGLAKVGTGTLTLNGANTYTGTTTITGGALQLGNGGTTGSIAGGSIVNNGALIINRSDAVTLANAISGTGLLVQDGTGTTRLTAANRYTGGTLVSRGRLVGDTAALQGTIQNNAVLEFAMPTNGTFAGALGGTGRVEKTGAGILTFAADGRNLTGPFAVLGGTLRMDGASGGRLDRAVVTLAAGTTLSGNGLIGGLVVEGGALVTPGNSLGVIGVTGDVTFRAASRFLAQITESGADLITAGGAARLAGTLDVVNLGAAAFRFNTALTIIEAAGGISGSFDAVTFSGFSPIYRPTLRATANGLAVVLAPNSLTGLAGTGLSANQAAVAARFDAAVAGGFDPQAFLGLYALAPAQLAGALDQLSGEIHPAMGRAAMRQSRLPREAVLERAAGVALPGNPQGNSFGTWGKLMRSWGDVAAAPGTASQQTDTEGFVIGIDGGTANDARALRFGVYGSHLNTRVAINARGSSGELTQSGGGVYASFAAGGLSLVTGAGAARFDVTTNRSFAVPGLAGSTTSQSGGDMAQVFGRVGYSFDLGAVSLEPFVAGDHAWIALDPAVERGGAGALSTGRQEYKVAGATTGLALKAPLGKLRIDAEAAARFELGDRAPQALIALAAAPGAATRIGAPRLAGTAFTGRLGAVLPITSRIEVRFDYAGEFSSTDTEHTAQAGLSIRF